MDYQLDLIGYPLGHSFSPEIHKTALVSCGLQGNYSLFPRQGDTKSALVLGEGGSARAVVYALASDGWEVMIAARRLEQAQSIVDQFLNPDSQISRIENNFTTLNSLLPNLSLIVNTTPVGMSPNIDASPWPANLPFPSNVAVYDLVYNPSQTKLVKDAHAVGLSATTGMGMLIEQAALSFEIWTGYTPQRSVLWNPVEH